MSEAGPAAAAHVAKPRRLRDAINAYRAAHNSLDQAALDLLNRLADSDDAAKAFMELQLCERDETRILQTFIQADQLARTFPQRIKRAEETLTRMECLDEAVDTLCKFLGELIAESKEPPTFDLLTAPILEPAVNIAQMKHGLYLLADLIDAGRRVAKEDLLRLGATRKKGQAANAQNAAIDWLGKRVRHVSGKAHLAAVTELAQAILQTELSEDRVSHAMRSRDREWRQP
jgi:hypothetical protein